MHDDFPNEEPELVIAINRKLPIQSHRPRRLSSYLPAHRANACAVRAPATAQGRVLVMQEKLSFGIGLPPYEF